MIVPWNQMANKPEIVSYYNHTKAGADALNQKVQHYSAYRKINRWPMAVFYSVS